MRTIFSGCLLLWLLAAMPVQAAEPVRAIFAGGCFWCMESEFQSAKQKGVIDVVSGYTGGHVQNPGYKDVSSGETGHAEAILVMYDPALIAYEALLDIFWSNIDPTDAGGQFHDRGSQYRTAIFYTDDTQRIEAEQSKAALEKKLNVAVKTEITAASAFYPAEDYHQDYYEKNAVHFGLYEKASGREEKIRELWKSAGERR